MSQNLTYLTTTSELNSVANAIRTKGGTSASLEYPQGFIDAIDDIETGGGVSSVTISGDCGNLLKPYAAKQMYDGLGSPEVLMTNVTNFNGAFASNSANTDYMLNDYSNFKINSVVANSVSLLNMFQNNTLLTVLPKLNCTLPTTYGVGSMFNGISITSFPQDWVDGMDFTGLNAATNVNSAGMFSTCKKLRSIPASWLPQLYSGATGNPSANRRVWNSLFYNCASLDEVNRFAAPNLTYTSNMFTSGSFQNTQHLSSFTFETNNGTPYTRSWTNQVIELQQNVGYFVTDVATDLGFVLAKRITDAASYAALKNDPDAWTSDINYSRFDHASAVALINSLPDTSAVSLPSAPSNEVKFKSASGTNTDAGAIGTLTQAEIDVAVNKGWKITLV